MVVGEFTEDVDIVILGGGPAGYAAAFALARGGRAPVVVDVRGRLGGTCLFAGCIGSKTLLHELCHEGASLKDAVAAADAHIEQLAGGLIAQADALGVRVMQGTARFADRRTVQVAGDIVGRLRFKRAIVCAGGWSAPVEGRMTPAQVLQNPSCLQGDVTVLGSSSDAVECAAIAAAAGCRVHLNPDGQLLPGVPRELVKPMERALKKSLAGVGPADDIGLVIDARPGTPDLSQMDLHLTQAVVDDAGWVEVSDTMQSADTRILAAGRCTGRSLWAGAALRMGAVAASTLLEDHDAWDPVVEPRTTWCPPGLTWCGPDSLDGLQTVTVPWGHSGQAVVQGAASAGRTLLAWDAESGTVLGAGAVGEGATEQAEAFTLAIELGATLEDLAACVPGHPTRAELLGVAAQKALS